MDDLEPEELRTHRLLSAVKPEPLPIGFRDSVMRSVRAESVTTAWEWIVAAALALPSLAYLVWELGSHGAELATSISAIMSAAQGLDQASGADFAIDGLAIVAFTLVGIASILTAHALLHASQGQRVIAR